MLYLDYAKPLADGKYILSFFADSVADLESISHGQKFVTKNGTDYGVPQAGSTVIVTSPNSGKTTYVMDAEGIWVVTEDISYSAVVANPSDAATAKLEKLKVNDTTYANWTENEIKSIASEAGEAGGKLYRHKLRINNFATNYLAEVTIYSSKNAIITNYNEFISYAPLYFYMADDSTANRFEGTMYISDNGDMSGFLSSMPTATNISAAEPIKGYTVEAPFETFFTTNDNEYNDTVTEL